MKRILAFLLALSLGTAMAVVDSTKILTMIDGATTTGIKAQYPGLSGDKTYQAFGTTGAGSGSAVIAVQCSNGGSSWDTLGTITLTLATTVSSDSFQSRDRCHLIRGNVTSLSGTTATVSLSVAY